RDGTVVGELATWFPVPLLSVVGDEIADGLWRQVADEPLPLALFDAVRTDYSLRRLVHYTGCDWRQVQPWILLTNYHRYVDQFVLHGLEQLRTDPRFVRMVLPGSVIIAKSMEHGAASVVGAGEGGRRCQVQ